MSKLDLKYVFQVAELAHGDQMYGDKKYSYHLNQVANIVKEHTDDELCVAIAYLHDVLEDTKLTQQDLFDKFGTEITKNVWMLTDSWGHNRKERKKRTNEKLSKADRQYEPALLVKTADRLANVLESKKNNHGLFKMYSKEHEDFKDAVYRKNLCEKLWEQLDKEIDNPPDKKRKGFRKIVVDGVEWQYKVGQTNIVAFDPGGNKRTDRLSKLIGDYDYYDFTVRPKDVEYWLRTK